MKSKLSLRLTFFLAGALFCLFNTGRAYGYVAIIRIDQTNIQTSYSFLRVKAVRLTNEDSVAFTITVVPGKIQRKGNFSGNLEVSSIGANGQRRIIVGTLVLAEKGKQIPTKDPAGQTKGKCVVFHFQIARDYLATSDFRIEETYGQFDPGPVDYIINPRDFAKVR